MFENSKGDRPPKNKFGSKQDGPRNARMPEGERYRKPAKESPTQNNQEEAPPQEFAENTPVSETEALREVRAESLAGTSMVIPKGVHQVVDSVSGSEVRVRSGSKLTIKVALSGSQVIVEDGGSFELLGPSRGSEVVYESDTSTPAPKEKNVEAETTSGGTSGTHQEYIPPELSEEELAEAFSARDKSASQKESPEITKQEIGPTYQSFEEAGFKPKPLSDAGRKWIFGIPMAEVHNTKAIPIDIENAFTEAGFTVELDNDGTKKVVRIAAPGANGALYESVLTHRDAVELLKNIAREQNGADAEAVSKLMNDKDTRADSTDVDSIDKPIAEESTMSAEEHTNPDVDDTNITTHYRDKKRARAATEELNKLNLSPSTKAQESSEAENENDPAVEPTVDTVETPLEEADAATKLTAGWRRVKAVPDINRSKREAEKRRTDTDAKLRLMRERIQAAYARQKQNAAAERMTENNDVPVSGVLGVDIELPGAVNAVDIDLTEPVPSSEAGGRPKSLTPEEALEAARIKVRKDLEEAMGGKSASGGEAAPSESGSDLNSSTEKITPESSDSEKLDEPVIIEDVGVTPMRGSQRSRESAEDIDFTEVDPASTEEQKNSAEEMLKELQKAYENGTYNTPEFAQLFPEFAADLEAAGGDRKAAMGLLLSKYEKLNQKVVEQRRKERHEKVAKIAQRFEAEFKISPEELASIEGVETLSEAQQKLLFENFTQLTLGNVREEAASLTANFTAEQRKAAVGTYGKVLGNAFAGIREAFTKSKNELANEKAVAKQQREGGFAAHRELLTELVQGMVENGPAVTEKDGELVIDLVNLSPEERGAEDSVVARAAALLSQEANAFARTPATGRTTLGVDEIKEKPGLGARFGRWLSTSKNDRNNQEQFLNAATAFESAKAGLTEALREQGLSDIQIAQRLLEVDTKVSQQQMLMTDPNAIEALAAIEDKSFWKETAKNFAKGNGLYFGLGFVGRTALGATGGVFAMPLVAAGVASLRSWDASAATLRERDRNQRAGVEESGPGALNVVSAERLIEKTERLIERANNPDASEEERQQALNSLRVRTEYIQDKMLLGRVSYGKKAEAVRSQTELAKLLGEAMTLLTAEEQNFRTAMADRYERLTGKLDSQQTRAEDRITDERSQYRSDHLTTSAYKASLFSIAGMALGAIADEAGTGNKMGEYLKDTKTRVSTWWEGTPLGGVVSGVEKLKELQGAEGGGVPPAEGIPPQAGEESVEAARAYTIERGDTLTKILKEQVLGEKVRPTGAELARFFDSLSAEELQSIGVRSDDADLIFAGETINTEKLQELWEGRNESISAVEESETDRLNRAAEIRTTVTPLEEKVPTEPFDIDETAASATAETDIDRSSAAESLNENLRSTPEVTADIITKLRARDIGKHLLETYRIEPNEWETLRVVKVRDVLDVAAKKDSWIDILGGTRIPKVGMDIRNLETVIEQAAEPGINIKPYSTETVEMFMLRLSTKLAEVQNPEKLPLFLKNIMKAFNEKTRTEIV